MIRNIEIGPVDMSAINNGKRSFIQSGPKGEFLAQMGKLFGKDTVEPAAVDHLLDEVEAGQGTNADFDIKTFVIEVKAQLAKSGLGKNKDIKACLDSIMNVETGEKKTYPKEYTVVLMMIIMMLIMKMNEMNERSHKAIDKAIASD